MAAGGTDVSAPPPNLDARSLTVASMVCALGDVFVDAVGGREQDADRLIRERCEPVAQATGVRTSYLEQRRSSAFDRVRATVADRAELEQLDRATSSALVGLIDRALPAIGEELRARDAILKDVEGEAWVGSAKDRREGHKAMSSRRELRDLWRWALTSDARAVGVEAEAISWLLAVDRFVLAERTNHADRPACIAPLFDTLWAVEPPSGKTSSDRTYAKEVARIIADRENRPPSGDAWVAVLRRLDYDLGIALRPLPKGDLLQAMAGQLQRVRTTMRVGGGPS